MNRTLACVAALVIVAGGWALVVYRANEAARAEASAFAEHAAARASAQIATKPASDDFRTLLISKVELLDELKARGFVLEAVPLPNQPGGETYRFQGIPATLSFVERSDKICGMLAMMAPVGDKANAPQVQDFLEAVGEVVAKLSPDEARVATAQAMADLGEEPLGPHRFVGYATADVLVKVTRMPDRGILFTFLPAPKLGQ